MDKHRVLVVGDSPYLDTGFSLLVREISKACYDSGYPIANVGLWDKRPNENIVSFGDHTIPWKVYSCKPPFANYANGKYFDILSEFNPTLVLIITDIWHAQHFMNNLIPSLYYFHVEGAPIPEDTWGADKQTFNWPEVLLRNHKVIFAGQFGKENTIKRIMSHIKKTPRYNNINIDDIKEWPVIPNGIDMQTFKPVSTAAELKKKHWNLNPDDVVLGFFSRQNDRKGLPYALEAFAKWPNRPDNVYFYIHTALKDRDGWNIEQMLEDLGITDKIILNRKLKVGRGVPKEELNELYNACTCVVAPSLGEGFGQTTCYAPGTLVKTKTGYLNIENVKTGMEVATHKGRYQKVISVSKIPYKGKMVKITPVSAPAFSTTILEKIMAIKGNTKEPFRYFGHKALDLRAGDLLKYPIIREPIDETIKKILLEKRAFYSDDKNLIFKYRDILINNEHPIYNSVYDINNKWAIKILPQKYKTKYSHYAGIEHRVTYITTPIKSTRVYRYNGFVYNLTVENDHSFLVNGVATVHNCQALAAGIPVIITDYSELSQFDKGTLKLKPIAYYIDIITNVKRAIPKIEDLIDCYQMVYDNKIEHLRRESRKSVQRFDFNVVKKQWINLFDSIPITTTGDKIPYIPQLNEWKYTNKEPKEPVSIIICTKDKPELIIKCVESILKYTNGIFEILIHDTGSTDRNVLAYYERIKSHKNIQIFKSNLATFNFSIANNMILKYAKYNTLLFLNNDTLVNPTWLSEMLKVLQDEKVGIVGSKLLFPNKTIQHAGVMVGNNGLAGHLYIGKPFNYKPANYAREVSAVTGACLMIKRDIFEKVGKFDEKYIIEFQDVDLCMKVRRMGYKVIYQPKSIVYHLAGVTRGNVNIHDALNDRPYFVAQWYNEMIKGDPYTPILYYNPNNYKLIEYWKNPPDIGDLKHG
jgi:GT2 family glycosyltransferase/glycosyltransferase involved in cell wall biosynthesis